MTAHTPGPWHVGKYNGVMTADGRSVLSECSDEENIANSRLCCAAPELLRLLRKASAAVAEIHAHDIGCPDCVDDAPCPLWPTIEAAIAKAEGRQ